MPKKKGNKTSINADFTINDSANALKPVGRVKKSVIPDPDPILSWEDLEDNEYDVLDLTNPDGSCKLVFVSKQNKNCCDDIHEGVVYPEIVWYLISKFIKPENIGKFALINKSTYTITKQESFWRKMYCKYCKNHPRLPEKLQIENSFVAYGLRQRVIRALFYTYRKFFKSTFQNLECSPHKLIERRCVSVWYCKARSNWMIFFKLKRQMIDQRSLSVDKINFLRELGRVDANPDEGCQVFQVTCSSLNEVPPLMGMVLSSVNVALAQGLMHQRLHLGFTSGICYGVKNIVPERSIVIDSVLSMNVYDWWHPRYPLTDTKLPSVMRDEELLPVLRQDFFTPCNGDNHKL